jgi:hypothetical protein
MAWSGPPQRRAWVLLRERVPSSEATASQKCWSPGTRSKMAKLKASRDFWASSRRDQVPARAHCHHLKPRYWFRRANYVSRIGSRSMQQRHHHQQVTVTDAVYSRGLVYGFQHCLYPILWTKTPAPGTMVRQAVHLDRRTPCCRTRLARTFVPKSTLLVLGLFHSVSGTVVLPLKNRSSCCSQPAKPSRRFRRAFLPPASSSRRVRGCI